MLEFELLGSLMKNLHQEFVRLYYVMLPVFFALAVTIAWVKTPQGGPEFLDVLKRAIVATILLSAFPEISEIILWVTNGIAEKIDNQNSLEQIVKMAGEKAKSYSLSPKTVLLQFNDFILAMLSFMSFLSLYFVRYIMMALFYFFWLFYLVTSPLLLLFHLFAGTAHIPRNLFSGMIEIACWKIVWALLGAMLTSLSFGNIYQIEGDYLTLIVMNFVIAIAMILTPLLVKSMAGSGAQALPMTIGKTAVNVMMKAPAMSKMAMRTFNKGMAMMPRASVGSSASSRKVVNPTAVLPAVKTPTQAPVRSPVTVPVNKPAMRQVESKQSALAAPSEGPRRIQNSK